MSMVVTSRIVKGGALLEDTRRLVDVWDLTQPPKDNLERVLAQNLLGKRSRIRLREILDLVLRPRFVDPGPDVIACLKLLRDMPAAFREACYYEAARQDPLIACFAEEAVFLRHLDRRVGISVREADGWLADQSGPDRWGDYVRRRVAQGLLATLRDFGILEGAVRKRLAPPHLSVAGFAYAAYREQQRGSSARALVRSTMWRRWLLHEAEVQSLFGAAQQQGILRYAQAGSVVRIDWRVRSLEDLARAAA